MTVRACRVFFVDVRGICYEVEVEAESLYEVAVLSVRRFRNDPWIEFVGNAIVLDVEVRESVTKYSISLQ